MIAREAAEKVRTIVDGPLGETAESAMTRILADGDDEAREALLYLLDEALLPGTTYAAAGGAVRGILAGPPLSMLASLFPRRLGTRSVKQLAKHLDELDAMDDEAGDDDVAAQDFQWIGT